MKYKESNVPMKITKFPEIVSEYRKTIVIIKTLLPQAEKHVWLFRIFLCVF